MRRAFLLLLFVAGCAHHRGAADRGTVSRDVEARTGQALGPKLPPEQLVLPETWSTEQKLTEDLAVLIALWNNPLFLETLTDLQMTRGDLVQAGLLPNPEFVYLWPEPYKPFKYLAEMPIEALWLRPIRMKAAAQENERTAARLTQAALDLIRDTRQAYADFLLGRERLRVADEAVTIRTRVFEMAEKRLKAGDASVQEVATARIDALQADQDRIRISYEAPVAAERLKNLLGLGSVPVTLTADDKPRTPGPRPGVDDIAAEAVRNRPDAIAARHFAEAATERLRLARIGWFRVLGIMDASSGRNTGHELGPAVRFTVPIFNWNQGNRQRAEAELEAAERRRHTVQNQIQLDVRQAYLRVSQAEAEMRILKEKVRPEVEAAIRRAEKAYNDGAVTYLIVLETTRQLIDAYNREAALHADLRRAWAELERSAGRRLE